MDQAIRNKLRGVVTQCRRLLEESVRDELQGKFGVYAAPKGDDVQVDADARMTHLDDEERAARTDILDHFAHIKARGFKPKESLDQLVREVAFTHLNRFCAYKMMEARQVYVGDEKFREAVSRGVNSNGVKFYLADHPDDERLFTTGKQDVAYRHFLDWLGGRLSDEIGVLFSPHDPANRLYPPQKVLDEVLALINDEGLADIWTQDETIGWVYQYFTPKELRDQARKESQAPRNSYELAFRNQFFTPRYVVEFLTDNTLGRIWYEMRKGDTKLKDRCRYMVRRPSEMFLKDGEQPPKDAAETTDDLTQDQLLKLPVYILHRAKKDPRELKILDPASGSGHFLLYCFDLLMLIYEEAYADPELGPALQRDYPTLDALRRDVPRLILAHNLHGIDIDLRASQIAALALWLRCQRAYQDMGLKKDRPRITRSNFVCAEPMPGEGHMLKEFVGQIEPKLLGQLVEVVFEKMKLAGEAGSLLKIEEEIRDAVAEAKQQWVTGPVFVQRSLFDADEPVLRQRRFDFSGITDAQFFEQAEAKVVDALRNYAEKAQASQRLQRRLFTDDAVRGFAFVDLCHKRFDVVLMNPPFGDGSKQAKAVIEKHYPRTKNDLYAAFVERGLNRLDTAGMLGAITSRTGFFLSSFQMWREELLLKEASPTVFADLGYGVLDTAMVETAAYCVQNSPADGNATFFRLVNADDKNADLLLELQSPGEKTFRVTPASFAQVPGSPFAYWVSDRVRSLFVTLPRVESEARSVKVGVQTFDDFRFVRSIWETSPTSRNSKWFPFAKGGAHARFHADIHLVVNFANAGREMSEFKYQHRPREGLLHRAADYYGRPGLTWARRSQRGLALRALPKGCIFSDKGPTLFVEGDSEPELLALLGIFNSAAFRGLVALQMAFGSFEVGVIQRTAISRLDEGEAHRLAELVRKAWRGIHVSASANSVSSYFVAPALIAAPGATIAERAAAWTARVRANEQVVGIIQDEIDDIAFNLYGLGVADRGALTATLINDVGNDAKSETAEDEDGDDGSDDTPTLVADLLAYALGAAFGHWDLRFATSDTPLLPESSPFDPLPVCPPGMLQNEQCLPLAEEDVGRLKIRQQWDYPLRINWEGILPDDPDHADDIIRRTRDVLEVIWKDQTDAIEGEANEALGVKALRDYFRKSGKGGFWDDHLTRHSKSRRKAPIYWLLQSSNKSYALWLYYPRLNKDLLFKALVNFVEPKIRLEDSRLETLRTQQASAGGSGRDAKRLGKDVERQEELLSELRDFEDKLRRAANLHLDPDPDDGVVLNIAPLWELVPWKVAKTYWEELLDGKYEWSSVAKQLRAKELVK